MDRTQSRNSGRPRKRAPLGQGRRIRDQQEARTGVVLDHACQYAHPKAQPVYSYLIRWDDGQVQALSETALRGGFGLRVVDADADDA